VSPNGAVKWTGSAIPAAVSRILPVRTLTTPAWPGAPDGISCRSQYSSGSPAGGSTRSPPTRQPVEVIFSCVKGSWGMLDGVGISKVPPTWESWLALVTNSASWFNLSLTNRVETKATLPSYPVPAGSPSSSRLDFR